jgi:hypothetical protein
MPRDINITERKERRSVLYNIGGSSCLFEEIIVEVRLGEEGELDMGLS